MRAAFGRITINSSAALAGAMLLAHPAAAQDTGSVSDYRLPDPKQSQAPRVQGPVDPENPYSTPSRTPQPERTAAPTPSPSAAPRINLPAPTSEERRPASRATATAPAPAPAPAPRTSVPTPDPSPAPLPSAAPPYHGLSTTTPPPIAPPPPPVPTDDAPLVLPPATAESTPNRTWWIVGAIALLAVAAGGLLLRRRRNVVTAQEVEEPAPAPPIAPPTPLRPRSPSPLPAPEAKAPSASPRIEPSSDERIPLALDFRPQAIRLSLVYATLQYDMELSNPGTTPLPPIAVRADLSSAHASIPTAQQLAPPPEALEIKHELAPLAPGESITLKGEVRLPIQQIRPLVKGNASFLVPLARFCFTTPDGTFVRRVFTLGPRDAGSGAIASVRLDAGPRNLRELDAREIEAARGFTLDPIAAHG